MSNGKIGFLPVEDPVLAGAMVTVGCQIQDEGGTEGISNLYDGKHLRKNRSGKIQPGKITTYFRSHTKDNITRAQDLMQAWIEQGEFGINAKPQGIAEIEKLFNEADLLEEPPRHTLVSIADKIRGWMPIATIQQIRRFVFHRAILRGNPIINAVHVATSFGYSVNEGAARFHFDNLSKGQLPREASELNAIFDHMSAGRKQQAREAWQSLFPLVTVIAIRLFCEHVRAIGDTAMDDSAVIPRYKSKFGRSGFKVLPVPPGK